MQKYYRLKKSDVVFREESFGGILYTRKIHTYYELNHTGIMILNALKQRRTLDELVILLSSFFDVPKKRLIEDIKTFLEELKNLNIIEEE